MWELDASDFEFQHFLDSVREPGFLTYTGRLSANEWAERALSNRLQISYQLSNDDRATAIGSQKIERPIIIVGLPRTGTTSYHKLFSLVPGVRVLKWYEAMWPAGFPGTEAAPLQPGEPDPRVEHAKEYV